MTMGDNDLKVARRNGSGVITRHLNSLEREVAEEDETAVETRLTKLKASFVNLEDAHYAYQDTLTDDAEVDASIKWLGDIQQNYIAKIQQARAWIKTVKVAQQLADIAKQGANAKPSDGAASGSVSETVKPVDSTGISVSAQVKTDSSQMTNDFANMDLITVMNMPTGKLDVFTGDPLDYQSFISLFDELIGKPVQNSQIKLTRLLQYTEGAAKAAIKRCALVGGEEGYKQARKLLAERFGDKHRITHSIIANLKGGPSVVGAKDFRQLADDVSTALVGLTKLDMLNELDTQQNIKDILLRCPTGIRDKFKSKAVKHRRLHGYYPKLSFFETFITDAAEELGDPEYGTESDLPGNSKVSHAMAAGQSLSVPPVQPRGPPVPFTPLSPPVPSFRSQPEPKCVVCSQSHKLFYCSSFKSMRVSERLDLVRRYHLCFNCLNPGHGARDCTKTSTCTVPACGLKHTKFLHLDRVEGSIPGYTSQIQNRRENATPGTVNQITNTPENSTQGGVSEIIDRSISVVDSRTTSNVEAHVVRQNLVYLPLVSVVVGGHQFAALLDSGSNGSFVSEHFASILGLDGVPHVYSRSTVGGTSLVHSRMVSFQLSSSDGSESTLMENMIVVGQIPVRYPATKIDIAKFPHLAGVSSLCIDPGQKADILIGMDNAHLMMPLEVLAGTEKSHPYAVRSVLGWSLNGPCAGNSVHQISSFCTSLEEQVQNLWSLETHHEDVLASSLEDQRVLDLWERETELVEGRYCVPVPWKDGRPSFPYNRYMACKRLEGTMKKLIGNGLMEKYATGIQEMLDKGYAEAVPKAELVRNDGALWYLPHQAVLSESKPGKVRIVFDCAAKQKGISLNSQALQGPDMVNKLLHVLLRFRCHPIAVTADIEAMYLQVRVPAKDRDCLRFLWYVDGVLEEFRMTSHLFGGIWCASSTTYALRRTVEDFVASSLVSDTVLRSFYVDDLLSSVTTTLQAAEVVFGTKEVIERGGFPLKKIIISMQSMLEDVDPADRATEVKQIEPEMQSKALGVRWQINQDSLFYVFKSGDGVDVTKRVMLSTIAAMYDPVGLMSPCVLMGRVIFQEATRSKLHWDMPVGPVLRDRWLAWVDSMSVAPEVYFPRCVIPEGFEEGVVELHHFCDASSVGYGACSYVRVINRHGQVSVSLLLSKARVAPVKSTTIPRLELSAAVVGAQLDQIVRRELGVHFLESSFWSDSQICLHYIRNEAKRYKTFVANRVASIRDQTTPDQWRYIPTKLNPADVLSRGCSVKDLPQMWFRGPDFLRDYKSDWPKFHFDEDVIPSADVEEKSCVSLQVDVASEEFDGHPMGKLLSYYSCFYRLKKALCWWLRLRAYLHGQRSTRSQMAEPLSLGEIHTAEKLFVVYVQEFSYTAELKALKKGNHVAKSSTLYKLRPVLHEDLVVVGGRLAHAGMSQLSRHPMVLPRNHRLSYLIALDYHESAHLGTEWTLSQMRSRFWIIRGRALIKKVKKDCVVCQRLYKEPMQQLMAGLPPERCEPGKPAFTFVGVDLFGPFMVKYGRGEVKRYGCVYSCFSTRAIHLEVLNSLETDSFLNGFFRFIARRGCPKVIWSDNGTNLVGACSELRKALSGLDRAKVVQSVRRREVDWRFNPPLASHQGGVWERMIRTIRRILLALVTSCPLMSDEVISTLFCEVECIVNSRPITKVTDDAAEGEPLTPNHFLMLSAGSSEPWGVFGDADLYKRRWRQVQHLSNHFWKRWLREYLPELQRRVKWNVQTPSLKVGDLVLIKDEQVYRGAWPLALVVDVNMGRDGLVRSARVKSQTGHYVRPITKLVHLEGV